jgi:hypothetical protein
LAGLTLIGFPNLNLDSDSLRKLDPAVKKVTVQFTPEGKQVKVMIGNLVRFPALHAEHLFANEH